ncbi:MAG: 1-deoxy-D-xylulose-5-phosphate reductoisomerase [Deltaproteobacteria bacterium]|jgi:1-deoxy-D-xylulose-5-phosphate reductoisomerase|nr:1-deoxy-D-xylulose-5-phosphate reductoisomerase [Deltaproteobacteria bacterium]
MGNDLITLCVLGATGSIGQQTLSIARAFPERIDVVALGAGRNMYSLARAVAEFRPEVVAVHGIPERDKLINLLKESGGFRLPEIITGEESYEFLAVKSATNTVLSAMSGAIGLAPTFAALQAGKKVALANKESLVLAGDFLMPLYKDQIFPVDSEHSAIFQSLGGTLCTKNVKKLILTASGGPFRGKTFEELALVTKEEALKHPNWKMGPKITIDSATLLNKGFEIIEAHHLFQIPYDNIEVLVHPQSIIHSMVEFQDGAIIGQLGSPDMRLAISYALSYPERWPLLTDKPHREFTGIAPVDFNIPLTFEKPDRDTFKCFSLAEKAGRVGGNAPVILNAAGEIGVQAFLERRINLNQIAELIQKTLQLIEFRSFTSVQDILAEDLIARRTVKKILESL